ncbi:MAG: chromosomal replication initiator protein DnaA [Chlamydiales bacterium]|nr:chromosomal replication initiator protein DnaA [Chlamydiales bacterium]
MKAWNDFLLSQEKELGYATVKKWLTPLKVTGFDACNLYLEAKDSFQLHWFEEHVRPIILSQFVNKNNKRIKVHLSIAKKIAEQLAPSVKKLDNKENRHLITPAFSLRSDPIDVSHTLDNFVSSKSNTVPYKLFCELAGMGNKQSVSLGSINPLFLSGPAGSGKTHLLMALATWLKSQGLKVIYTRAETFTEHVVSSIRAGEMQFFRESYRNIDALFIDDIEIFSRKGATQEELFHTFNSLHLEGKQIILSSKNLPKDLHDIEPRLISRFEWGIVLILEPLQKDEMKQLLLQKIESMNIKLPENTIEFFLNTFKNSSKSLLKALEALVLRSHLEGISEKNTPLFSLDHIRNLLADLIKIEEESILTPRKIIKTVAEFYGIRVDDILGKAQSKECSFPRQMAMYLCRSELQLAFMKIGDLFSRDHSTVMTSIKQIEKAKASDPNIMHSLTHLSKTLKS